MTLKKLVVVDGLDGCGKDSHARRIRELIEAEGRSVVIISHPSRRRFGALSKRALQGSGHVPRVLATIFYTLDVLLSVARFNREKDGTFVFVRYTLGTAYLPRRLAPAGYRVFRNLLPLPNLAIFIDIDPDVAMRRIEGRDHKREMFETMEKLVSVRQVAKELAGNEWTVIDNSEDGEAPFERLHEVLVAEKLLRNPPKVTSDPA